MIKISKFFSYVMYWIENIVLLFCFLIFELFLLPLAYIQIWFNILKCSFSLRTVINFLLFLSTGPFLMLFIVFRDFYYLFRICSCHQGCRASSLNKIKPQQLETTQSIENEQLLKIRVFNEVRVTVICLFKRLKKYMNNNEEEEDSVEDDINYNPEYFMVDEEGEIGEEFLY